MVQKTIDGKELEREYVVVGVPVSEAPRAQRGSALQEGYRGNKRILFGLELESYFPFYITKQVVRDILGNVMPSVPLALRVNRSPSIKPTYVLRPCTREDVLESITAQIPRQLYLRSQEKVRRASDTKDISEDEVLHRLWIEGDSLFKFFDAGVVLEARYKNIGGVDFTKARFRSDYEGHWSTGLLLRGADFTSILDKADRQVRQEEKEQRNKKNK